MINNAINNNILSFPLRKTLTGIKFPNTFVSNAGSGDVDIYTCPSGKRCLIINMIGFNSAGTTTTWYPEINVSATYYRLSSDNTSAANATTPVNCGIILEAGEKISIHTSQAGMNIWVKAIEFDSTANLSTKKLLSLSSGNNTLYTVPANTSACILYPLLSNTGVNYVNSSGGSRNINIYRVASGGSTGTTNLVFTQSGVADATFVNGISGIALSTGDFLVINTDASTATQIAWVNVEEFS